MEQQQTLMAILPELKDRYQKNPSALVDEIGSFLSGASFLTSVHQSTAIIEISGLIFPAKLQRLNFDLQAALANPNIENIVLNINSGGGYVAGVHEFATKIAEADKPISAYIFGIGASAAYWIAAAADTVVIDAIAQAGSIGVVATFFDWSGYDEKIGLKEIEILNTDSPLKRVDVTTEEGQAIIRKQLDDMAAVFFGDVATFRNITVEDVAALQGNIFVGEESVRAGLADATGSLEGLLSKLNGEETTMALKVIQPDQITKAFLKENFTAVFDEIVAGGVTQGKAEGAQSERERLIDLDSLNTHGSEDAQKIVKEAKADPSKNADGIARQLLGVIEIPKGSKDLDDIKSDSPDGVSDNPESSGDEKELDALIQHGVAAINKRRGGTK